jgi:hypothetical protein
MSNTSHLLAPFVLLLAVESTTEVKLLLVCVFDQTQVVSLAPKRVTGGWPKLVA